MHGITSRYAAFGRSWFDDRSPVWSHSLDTNAIRSAEANTVIVGSVERMTRAPFVVGKAEEAYWRTMKLEDTTLCWRFINPLISSPSSCAPARSLLQTKAEPQT